ncbi:hypothetical protein BH23GEM8_BH23GEM8_19710 [soil metagenome]
MTTRRLVSTRRKVAAELAGEYDATWAKLRAEVTDGGAHAWRFVSAGYPTEYLEFLEFASTADPRAIPDAMDLMAELDRLSPGSSEEWDESPG